MSHLFATRDDWTELFRTVESRLQLRYVPCGVRIDANAPEFLSGLDLPEPGKAAADSHVGCASYLVRLPDTAIEPRRVTANDGVERFYFDQLHNPNTVVIDVGGVWATGVLINGRVATASKTPEAKKLLRRFQSALRRRFAKIQAYRVGPDAEKLLDAGWRLTAAVQSPPLYDLKRPT